MRLFVALQIPDEVRAALIAATKNLKSEAPDARWSRPESLHVTLKFLGETKNDLLERIRETLANCAANSPIALTYRGVGFFPDEKKPRVLWAGVEATPNLAELAAQIDRELKPLGFEPETRPYVPHITLARLNSARTIEKLVRAAAPLKSYHFGAARESEFHLFESVLKPTGSEYKKLFTFAFVKEQS